MENYLSLSLAYIHGHVFHNIMQAFPSLSLIFLRALAKSNTLGYGWQLLCGRWVSKVGTDGSTRSENQAKEQVRNQAGKPQPGQQFPEEQIRAVWLTVL